MKVTRTKKKSSLVQEISKALDMSPISFPMRFQTRFLITRNMWRKRTENTQTLFSKVFFDCTNYYFEIDLPKEDKQKGPSKENKHEPIIGQALLLYVDLVPLAMQMYPGNESEKPYIRKIIQEMKERYKVTGKTVQVADKGLNCARNIYAAVIEARDGYIFSKSVHGKGLSEKEKQWLLLENDANVYTDYRDKNGKLLFRLKSCVDTFSYKFKELNPETGEEKVISLYARGMSTRDIHDQLQDLYGIELSAEMVSKITDKILPQVKEWQSRPLNPVYPFVFMDCIHYKVREDGRILSRAAYVVLGVTVEGYKDILSITVGANETSKFWLGMLNDLKNRGVKDVLFFCVDGLPGFKEAIQAVYPQAEIQRCVIHMLRNSFKYVNYNDLKKFSSDFKAVYNAPNETAALSELENIKEKWGKKYPYAISNWENNWEDVSSFFQFSNDIRRIMYTTNIIEGLNRQYRKVTKTKSVFPSDTALEKMLYLASENVVRKWTQRYRNWDQVLNQLIVLYGERLTNCL